jgi:hypothetical protein
LEEVFGSLQDSGLEDELLRKELVRKIRAYNHIPPGLEEKYGRALLKEYKLWLTDPRR